MNFISNRHDRKERVFSETEFLLRLIPGLEAVRRKKRGWDAYGEMLALHVGGAWKKGTTQEVSLWKYAKRVVHAAMTGVDAKDETIRKRVQTSHRARSLVFSDLSLWLSGKLGIPISETNLLVAAMLIGLAESEGDWNTLVE